MFNIGDSVFALWGPSGLYHLGTVVNNDGGSYHVVFEDGDQADSLSSADLKPANLQIGSKVLAMWSDKKLYSGTISQIVGRALFISFDDGDQGWTSMAGIALK